jgi:hypothetical protein
MGNKDVSYIAGLFEDQVIQYDPQMRFTDVFFFNGANVQMAGQILMAKFPHTFLFSWWRSCCITLLFVNCQDQAH